MEMPTVEDLAVQLQDVSGAEEIDVDAALQQISDVDSLDLMEWLYNFQSAYPHIPADESLFSDMDDTTTLRTVHGRIVALVAQPATQT
jgi:acyl carrier protein